MTSEPDGMLESIMRTENNGFEVTNQQSNISND
jgi:hypothetical protein